MIEFLKRYSQPSSSEASSNGANKDIEVLSENIIKTNATWIKKYQSGSQEPAKINLFLEELYIRGETAASKDHPNIEAQHRKISNFVNGFIESFSSDNFEFGKKSNTEKYVLEWLKKDKFLTQTGLNQVFIQNIKNIRIMTALLQIISHIERSSLVPTCDTIAIAALSHISLEVRECGIRAFEYWEDPEVIPILESIQAHPAWLEEYKQAVLEQLRGD